MRNGRLPAGAGKESDFQGSEDLGEATLLNGTRYGACPDMMKKEAPNQDGQE